MQSLQQRSPHDVLDELRAQLNKKGKKTIRSLGRVFRNMDTYANDGQLNFNELLEGLKNLDCEVTRIDAKILLAYLDKNQNGFIDTAELLTGIRGRPTQRRQMIIDKAFLKFDVDCSGMIEPLELKKVYNVSQHPKVRTGEMTEEQVFAEFLSSFGDTNHDFRITRAEWNDYYAAVSCFIDNDDHFILLMKNAWML